MHNQSAWASSSTPNTPMVSQSVQIHSFSTLLRLKDPTECGTKICSNTLGNQPGPHMEVCLTWLDTLLFKMPLSLGWTQLKPGSTFLLQWIKRRMDLAFTLVSQVKVVL